MSLYLTPIESTSSHHMYEVSWGNCWLPTLCAVSKSVAGFVAARRERILDNRARASAGDTGDTDGSADGALMGTAGADASMSSA